MGFEYDKFKVQIKLAISRINNLQVKHQNSLCGRRKEVADLLRNGQEERARLLVRLVPVGRAVLTGVCRSSTWCGTTTWPRSTT